jgi:hypothetical protein
MNKEKGIRLLNKGVADELQAVHQFMFFHFHLNDQGFAPPRKVRSSSATLSPFLASRIAAKIA